MLINTLTKSYCNLIDNSPNDNLVNDYKGNGNHKSQERL